MMRRCMMIACLVTGIAGLSANTTLSQHKSGTAMHRSSGKSLQKGSLSGMDREFMMKAAQGGAMEVTLGRMATQKAASGDVKQFGQRMVSDHSKANSQLMQLAQQKRVKLSKTLTGEKLQMTNHLKQEKGVSFDKAYMQHMVEDHEEDVAEFEKASQECSDPQLKQWATKTLPVLREHLQMARGVAGKVGASNGTTKNGG